MNTSPPRISVVMPVYNGERFLDEAIVSIISQTFADFEFIIVDDGSQDGTPEILQRFQNSDPRIVIHRQPYNVGITACLNLGCSLAQGEFIARMDADDISLPLRFEMQVRFLDANPRVALVGTQAIWMDSDGIQLKQNLVPELPKVIGWRLLVSNPIIHPSVMMRRAAVKALNFYRVQDLPGQDYDLWARLSMESELANLPDLLLKYRVRSDSITGQKQAAQARSVAEVMRSLASHYLRQDISFTTADALRAIAWNQPLDSLAQIRDAASLLERLYSYYVQAVDLSPGEAQAVAEDTATRFYALARRALKISPYAALKLGLKGAITSPRSMEKIFAYYRRQLFRRRGHIQSAIA